MYLWSFFPYLHPLSHASHFWTFIFVLWFVCSVGAEGKSIDLCGHFTKEIDEGDRSTVETCARSCAPWSIRLHCPFKPPPGSPALLLWLASVGSVASSDNVAWGSQCFTVCSEMLNILLKPLQVTVNIVCHCWCCGGDWSCRVCQQVGLS